MKVRALGAASPCRAKRAARAQRAKRISLPASTRAKLMAMKLAPGTTAARRTTRAATRKASIIPGKFRPNRFRRGEMLNRTCALQVLRRRGQ